MRISPPRPRRAGVLAGLIFCAAAVSAQQLAFEQVVGQLRSTDAGTRLSALRLLGETGYPEAAVPVAALLSDPEPRVRLEALATELSLFLGDRAARKRVAFVMEKRDPYAAQRAFESGWASMPAGRVPVEVPAGLVSLLSDPRPAVRAEALYAIGVLGQIDGVEPEPAHKGVVEALAARLGDGEPAVRMAAARTAGRFFRRCPGSCQGLAVDRVGDALVHLLNEPDAAVQGAAMEGLGEMRYQRAVKALTDLHGYYRTGEMAYGALDTLARIAHGDSLPLFKAALTNRDPNFRRAAVEGLARIGTPEAVAALPAADARERDMAVRLAIAFADNRTARSPGLGRIVQALASKDLRWQAQDYLVELGPPVVSELAGALPAATTAARTALLEVIGINGGPAESALLGPLRHNDDPRVAAAAERALARIRSFTR
jgi:HEAT repeat protein